MKRAGAPESAARSADDGLAAGDSEIHEAAPLDEHRRINTLAGRPERHHSGLSVHGKPPLKRAHGLASARFAALPSRMSDTAEFAAPTVADVDAAARRLAGVALRTPLVSSPVLDAVTGARVFLKAETLQRTGSFKFRGAFNKLSSIAADKRAGGVVAFSSGNHAQGVAHAAKLLDMPSVIVMPSDAPRPKRERTKAFGAEVVLYDREKEDREAIARAIAGQRGATLVPPYDDPFIIAGQGTAGREIMEDMAALGLTPDVVVIGASGGGLAAGISIAVKARAPDVKIYTAEPEGFDDTARSFRSGKHERNARLSGSICDALMSNTPGKLTFPINRRLIGEGIAASDDEVARAVSFAFRELKLVVEPGGAIGLATLLAGRPDVKGKIVVAVLSGGNVDPELFHRLVA
jgi:threonine dehydratase